MSGSSFAGICAGCCSLSSKEHRATHFSACWGNTFILDLSTAVYSLIFNDLQWFHSLSFHVLFICLPHHLSQINCEWCCMSNIFAAVLSSWLIKLEMFCIPKSDPSPLWSQVWRFGLHWLVFFIFWHKPLTPTPSVLGAAVLVCWLLFYSGLRTCLWCLFDIVLLPIEPFWCCICDQ